MYTDQQYKEIEELLTSSFSIYDQYISDKNKSDTEGHKKCDVLKLDEKIKTILRSSFSDNKEKLIMSKQQLKNITGILEQSPDDETLLSEKKRLELDIKQLEQTKNTSNLQEYIYLSSRIVDEFQEHLKKPKKVSFFSVPHATVHEDKLSKLTEDFLEIAKKYIPVQTYHSEIQNKNVCEVCGNSTEFSNIDNIQICETCGAEKLKYSTQTNYKDVERINLSPKYKYKKSVHFRDTVNQYQGKQNKKINQKVYDDLETEFYKHNLIEPRGTKTFHEQHKKITKEHVYTFLSETGHNKYYEDINLIYRYFTGNPCPDISHLENELFSDFDKVAGVYKTLTDIDRTNFLNGQYVLYQLLRRRGVSVRESDFDILKTRERLSEHDDIWMRICVVLEWTFRPTV
jgi:hypothetical protein